uniref:Metastriate one of each protein family n=1 Tax=Rhipicephalus zambeziensis TaxID=60191 RepID=A0A224YCU0_9ACAR
MAKMAPLVLFAVVTFLIASSEATLYGADTTCDYTGLRVDNELSRMLARLPETHAFGPERVRSYWPGLEVGGFTVEGLNKLRLYGPLFPYCINGTRMLQVDFLNEGETSLSLPWKICSGHEGRFRLRTSLSRFTAQFRVAESPENGVKLEPMGRIVPVTTDGVRVIVEGAGSEVRTVFEVLSAMFPGVVNEVWYWNFSLVFDRTFRELIE